MSFATDVAFGCSSSVTLAASITGRETGLGFVLLDFSDWTIRCFG